MHTLPPRPNAIAFRDPSHGLLGTSRSIEATANGGRSWTVVFRVPRPVTWIGFDADGRPRAILDDGENLGGPRWRPVVALVQMVGPCPAGTLSYQVAGWALCTTQGGAGNEGKSVYRLTLRGWRLVADTLLGVGGYGGISSYGYPQGIAMAADGFGLIWESRGTLYVTRNGGSHWVGLPDVAQPEVDFGISGAAVRGGVGFVLLARGWTHRRLLETSDAGRSWHLVHRWS